MSQMTLIAFKVIVGHVFLERVKILRAVKAVKVVKIFKEANRF
jgi:hypothetical protein